jgi:xyloglucan-specific exo-beta-1,4-glucanase
MDWAGPTNASFYGVSALALDPSNGARVFALTGSYWRSSNCSILMSSNAGTTWTLTAASEGWGLRCGANEGDRNVGDRMAVHPTLPDTVAVGGSDGAVYITNDAFATAPPVRVLLPPPAHATPCNPTQNASCVVLSVAWLDIGAAAPLLVAAVPSAGLFASAGPDYSDAGTWSFVSGSDAPSGINRLATLPGGRIWATASVGGVWSGTIGAVAGGAGWKVSCASGSCALFSVLVNSRSLRLSPLQVTWGIAGALADTYAAFAGIAVSTDGMDVVVMSLEFNSTTRLWRSLDGGDSFAAVPWTLVSQVPWWGSNAYDLALNAACSLSWDPHAIVPTIWATGERLQASRMN